MVPKAEFTSYYGRQNIKSPTWKVPDVPGYLYLGGLAGASATIAALSDLTGLPALRRAGRVAAAGGAMLSTVALVHDLGRPTRFLNMLRVFKPTSPLSVGSWILAPFSTLVAIAAASELTGKLPLVGRLAGLAGGLLGPPMTTYTAVLLADTAVPGWHEAYRELPFVFAGSALASAGGVAIAVQPVPAARRVAVTGGLLELAASARLESQLGLVHEARTTGRAGWLIKASRGATVAGTALAAFSGCRPGWGRAAGVLLNAGAAALRFGVFEAGMASARDPKYVVVPQRERLDAGQAAAVSTSRLSE